MTIIALTMVVHAEKLASLMKKRGWNQVTISKKSGVSQQQISNILSGRRYKIRMETVEKLARAFGMTVDQYMGLPGKPEPEKPDALTQKFIRMLKQVPAGSPILKILEDIIDGQLAQKKT